MSYSTLATAGISLALLAIGVAAAAAILLAARRRRWAEGALKLVVALLVGGAGLSFLAAAEGDHDLQAQARRTLSLVASAERVTLARYGRYTTSVATLQRLSPALADEIRNQGATVRIERNRVTGTARLRVSLGFGSLAEMRMPAPAASTGHSPRSGHA
jgi:hypothetical protein